MVHVYVGHSQRMRAMVASGDEKERKKDATRDAFFSKVRTTSSIAWLPGPNL